jgi:hypothetical protein
MMKRIFSSYWFSSCCALHPKERDLVGISPNGTLPFSKSGYYHFAKDKNFSALIRDFFSMQGITGVINHRINCIVTDKFSKMNPVQFWTCIANTYGLVFRWQNNVCLYKCRTANTDLENGYR